MCELTGYSESELLDVDFQRISHPDDVESDLALMDDMLSGENPSYQLEKRYTHAQRHSVWVLVTASLVRETDGRPLGSGSYRTSTTANSSRDSSCTWPTTIP